MKHKLLKFLSNDFRRDRDRIRIAAGIALAIIAVVNGLGTNLNGLFSSINNSLK